MAFMEQEPVLEGGTRTRVTRPVALGPEETLEKSTSGNVI